jgi:hypothetical protein
MAKLKLGAMLGDARNAMGGMVFSKNQFGSYARQKVSPVQPRGALALAVRAQVQHLATYWANTLDAAKRAAWIALAQTNPVSDVFGDSQVLTGLQYFVRVNRNIMKFYTAVTPNAPADQNVTPLTSLSLVADISDVKLELTFTPTPLGANEVLEVWATPLLPQGRAYSQNFLKFIMTGQLAGASPHNAYSVWVGRFGTMIAGPKIYVQASILNLTNGAVSAPLQASTTVVA